MLRSRRGDKSSSTGEYASAIASAELEGSDGHEEEHKGGDGHRALTILRGQVSLRRSSTQSLSCMCTQQAPFNDGLHGYYQPHMQYSSRAGGRADVGP